MQARLNALTVTAALGALTLGLAACGGGSTSNSAGTPGKGGTLKIVDAGDVDHLDTASGYTTTANALERAWTRQLFSYKASNDIVAGSVIVADAATDIPSAANGGISADGKTITVHLRTGVKWNTTPAREVVANDWIRGIKRECNPDKNGAGG
ncbi:MAG: transporter substrate-binding protein, partial [Actinomycetia bacterium]|nr:transporter substrate-binding protein [Actinomycetes bacterium]